MGRFVLGFVVGAAIGVVAARFVAPYLSADVRQKISDTYHEALDVARQASAVHEQVLWNEFRTRLSKRDEPPAAPLDEQPLPPSA